MTYMTLNEDIFLLHLFFIFVPNDVSVWFDGLNCVTSGAILRLNKSTQTPNGFRIANWYKYR